MVHKRLMAVTLVIILMLVILIGRLMQIQLFQTENFSKHHVNLIKESVNQRTQDIVLDDGRGQFIDKDGKPLSYEEKTVLVMFPFVKSLDWKSEEISNIINVPRQQLETELQAAKEPFVLGGKEPMVLTEAQTEQINRLRIPGVFAVKKKYPSKQKLAEQLIGVYGENEQVFKSRYPNQDWRNGKVGITGMQRNFDEFLFAENDAKLVYHVDGIGDPLFGIDVKYTGQGNPFFPLQVKTTIESSLQEKIEDLLDHHQVGQGGAVLLDIKTNDILAIASRPKIDEKHPFADDGTINMMFKQSIPGSVFKTVIAAAAIEEGLISEDRLFNCDVTIRGELAERELGQLHFTESFARSCNRTFADLGIELMEKDPSLIEKYASKLGLLSDLSWHGNVFQMKDFKQFEHDRGRLFLNDNSKTDRNFIAQTSIGQHEVRISPIAVANMMATIARGGERKKIRAASEIQYKNGATMLSFKETNSADDEISKYAAIKLQKLLREVVIDPEGTGSIFQQLPYDVAGKSGTAETGKNAGDGQLHNKWFAGYFPFENPAYALVVVHFDVPIDQGGINPLFADIVTEIYKENNERLNESLPLQ